jgi:tRNA dimethylallyltransferase
MTSVGYREVAAYTKGQLSRDALADAIVRSTRVFARRQRTWLRSVDVTWL